MVCFILEYLLIETPTFEVASKKKTSFGSLSNFSTKAAWSNSERVYVRMILPPLVLLLKSKMSNVSALVRNCCSVIYSCFQNIFVFGAIACTL